MYDIIILMKIDQHTPYGVQRLQQINMLVEKIITNRNGPPRYRKSTRTTLYDRDRDWPV